MPPLRSWWMAGAIIVTIGLAATVRAARADQVSAPFYGDPAAPDISGLWLGTLTGRPGVPFAPPRPS